MVKGISSLMHSNAVSQGTPIGLSSQWGWHMIKTSLKPPTSSKKCPKIAVEGNFSQPIHIYFIYIYIIYILYITYIYIELVGKIQPLGKRFISQPQRLPTIYGSPVLRSNRNERCSCSWHLPRSTGSSETRGRRPRKLKPLGWVQSTMNHYGGVLLKRVVHQNDKNGWFITYIRENQLNIDDLGYSSFRKPPCINEQTCRFFWGPRPTPKHRTNIQWQPHSIRFKTT